ncbi:MAG: ribosome biogenesis GTP-binding protein YihA/YsxC [Coriobacteriia bacterium]|nr:ribosome biogenesis GTP-binding protein YihA/YsxC [Coriobacteriia bacterium]MBS5477919.1 ribosome biogenesis GTP-binding protein YihA/YsxC [Coriobacteriia bacterium]
MALNYNLARFERACGRVDQLPASTVPEVAFAGRSNVGKSSLLNKLLNRKSLAKVSQTPGKTATINFYEVDKIRFVDLPGYGYAQVSKSERQRWSGLIDGYFNQQRRFALVAALADIRHPAQQLDIAMVRFLTAMELPFCVVLTKADKLGPQAQQRQEQVLREGLGLPEDVQTIVTSSEKGWGISRLRSYLEACCREA